MRKRERFARWLIARLQSWGCYSEAVSVAQRFFKNSWRVEV
ncbi:hypothetical protein [Aminomonas paucivorans]|uniref:Uncharacterized protein n=1 Tax=Aminomonas paucivorans DSM 12260 TaxID=584708 RepID=E3CWX1_9BACT|nr:hypothetical protein [Aminomonas paucivorans]EFQ23421.1 hypothetical protein Apau_0994 [Aminomonas paucivorans DSM 12260]